MKKRDVYAASLVLHKKYSGKLEIASKVPLKNRADLTLAYTPGVGAVSRDDREEKKLAEIYTLKSNTVAIVSDGSAILGLGNLGRRRPFP